MYLTRLFLDPASRAARADIASPEGLHKTVMRLFPMNTAAEPRKAHGVLHRLDESRDGRLMLLVQSRAKPNTSTLPAGYLADLSDVPALVEAGISANPSVRSVDEERGRIAAKDRFVFRLKANTTRKIGTRSGPDGKRVHGRRVPVRGDDARLEWLKRHATAAGFDVMGVRVSEVAARGRHVRLAGAIFEGILEVEDPVRFREALETGLGPAKAFGFGLLSIARP
jgi:CRISPR system Cascade subunit CasE